MTAKKFPNYLSQWCLYSWADCWKLLLKDSNSSEASPLFLLTKQSRELSCVFLQRKNCFTCRSWLHSYCFLFISLHLYLLNWSTVKLTETVQCCCRSELISSPIGLQCAAGREFPTCVVGRSTDEMGSVLERHCNGRIVHVFFSWIPSLQSLWLLQNPSCGKQLPLTQFLLGQIVLFCSGHSLPAPLCDLHIEKKKKSALNNAWVVTAMMLVFASTQLWDFPSETVLSHLLLNLRWQKVKWEHTAQLTSPFVI